MSDTISTLPVANRLGVTSARVHQFVRQGRLVPIVVPWCEHGGGKRFRFRFTPEEIERFAAIPRPNAVQLNKKAIE